MAQGPVAQGLCGSRALWLKDFVAQRPVAQGQVAQGPVAQGLCCSRALWLKGLWLMGSRAANNYAIGGGSDGIIIQLCLNPAFELQLLTIDFLDLGVNLF